MTGFEPAPHQPVFSATISKRLSETAFKHSTERRRCSHSILPLLRGGDNPKSFTSGLGRHATFFFSPASTVAASPPWLCLAGLWLAF